MRKRGKKIIPTQVVFSNGKLQESRDNLMRGTESRLSAMSRNGAGPSPGSTVQGGVRLSCTVETFCPLFCSAACCLYTCSGQSAVSPSAMLPAEPTRSCIVGQDRWGFVGSRQLCAVAIT